ncbi:MAG: NADP-dependent isocitrate dehydrogenase [bacterium]
MQDDKPEEVKCVIPDRCYSSMYAAIIQDCKYVQHIYLEKEGWGLKLAGEGEVFDP